jgi:hypothetical protein
MKTPAKLVLVLVKFHRKKPETATATVAIFTLAPWFVQQ